MSRGKDISAVRTIQPVDILHEILLHVKEYARLCDSILAISKITIVTSPFYS